jgi:dethiobiotin synthetase
MDFTYEVIGNQIQTQLIGSYSYKYNNSPTLALNSTSVKIPISLIALKLTSLTLNSFLC